MFSPIETVWRRFRGDRDANLLTVFALSAPLAAIAGGVAIDFSRAISEEAGMQAALDSAVLEGAKVAASSTQAAGITAAQNIFYATLAWTGPTPTFSFNGATLDGRATFAMPTMFARYIGQSSINLDVACDASAEAAASMATVSE